MSLAIDNIPYGLALAIALALALALDSFLWGGACSLEKVKF